MRELDVFKDRGSSQIAVIQAFKSGETTVPGGRSPISDCQETLDAVMSHGIETLTDVTHRHFDRRCVDRDLPRNRPLI